jgi:multiple sugar transport system substrate-binding protein
MHEIASGENRLWQASRREFIERSPDMESAFLGRQGSVTWRRTRLVGLSLLVGCASLAALTVATGAGAKLSAMQSSNVSWAANCKGVTLNTAFLAGGPYDAIYNALPTWEQTTGGKINVVLKGSGADFTQQAVPQALALGTPRLDVTWTHTSFFNGVKAYLLPLNKLFTKADLKPFYPSVLKAGMANGKLYLMPRHLDVGILYYRKDLFSDPAQRAAFQAKYGYALHPPRTFKEYADMAHFFTQPDKGLYGTSLPGKAEEALQGRFYELLVSFGGKFLSADGKTVAFGDKHGLQVLNYLRDLYATGAIPAATTAMSFGEQDQLFASGKVAFYDNFPYAWSIYNDPKQSQVAGKFGIADNPAGPGGHVSWSGAHGWAIAKWTKSPKCSASLIKFLTSEQEQLTEDKQGFLPVRYDTAKALLQSQTTAIDKVRIGIYSAVIKNEFLPVAATPKWVAIALKITPTIQQVMLGDTLPAAGLKQMVSQANAVLKGTS